MKSLYELAMERMGWNGMPLNDEQEAKIAEIDSKYKAKITERKIFLEKSVQYALAKGSKQPRGKARIRKRQKLGQLKKTLFRI